MKEITRNNLVVVALLTVITSFTAYREGYVSMISIYFGIPLVSGLFLTAWLALTISTVRLVSLIWAIFVIEYIKESIGIDSGFWVYHGISGHYNFGIWSWVIGGLSVYTLASKAAAWLGRRGWLKMPRRLNIIIIICFAVIVISMLGPYRSGAGLEFYVFYAFVVAVCLYSSARMEFRMLAAITVTSWVAGYLSEYAGSVTSGIWTYPHNPGGPPFFLIFGCWPLEITAQVAVSSLLADEPLV